MYTFIDSCSLTFWRVAATLSWWGHSQPNTPPSIDNKNLMGWLESQYLSSLDQVSKTIGVSPSQMLLVRDTPHQEIWRRDYYPSYKENRDKSDASSKYGPFIRHLNSVMETKYMDCIRVHRAEADDIIAVLVRYLKLQNPDCKIVIVANDSDYNQLLRYSGVRIYNPKTKSWIQCDDPIASLNTKILKGDSSDSIPAGTPAHIKRLLIDLSYIPRNIQDAIITSYLELSTTEKHKRCLQYYPMPIQLGLCCMNTKLRQQEIMCSRTMRLDTLKKQGLEELKRRARLNCVDLLTHLKWNAEHGIRVFRMSSDLFPHKSNPKAPDYTLDFVADLLTEAGQFARDTGQRLTFHPGQYNVVGTPKEDIFMKTKADLDYHAEVLDLMGCGIDSVMVVHAGGTYGDKEATKRRWIEGFKKMPDRVQRRLVLECCEHSFSVVDCLDVSRGWTDDNGDFTEGCGVPVVLDTHHFDCYIKCHPKEKFKPMAHYIPMVLETWKKRGIKPKMHVSEQNPEKQLGAHSDLIKQIPDELMEIPALYGVNIDIMIEAKLKEQAIDVLYQIHPQLNPHPPLLPSPPPPPKVKIRAQLRDQPVKVKIRPKFRNSTKN